MLTPPEYAIILWHLARTPLGKMIAEGNVQWADMSIGEMTGLPIVGINFQAAGGGEAGPRYCPFLLPVAALTPNGIRHLNQAWCGLRDARPGACRIFPLGRMLSVEAGTDFADISKWSYFITTRCPGFEPAHDGEDVPPGYAPPNGRLLRDWLRQQFNAEQDRLKAFYMQEVMPAYLANEVHAPVPGHDGNTGERGLVSPQVVHLLGVTLLYSPPPAPEDSGQDYTVLMKWLEYLRDFAPTLRDILSSVARTPQAQMQALHQYAHSAANRLTAVP